MSLSALITLGVAVYLLIGLLVSRKIETFWGLGWPNSFREYCQRLGLLLCWPFPLTIGLIIAAFYRWTHRTSTVRLGTD